jgi:hypothetical protein
MLTLLSEFQIVLSARVPVQKRHFLFLAVTHHKTAVIVRVLWTEVVDNVSTNHHADTGHL